jgi:hypothetical protein
MQNPHPGMSDGADGTFRGQSAQMFIYSFVYLWGDVRDDGQHRSRLNQD